MTCYYKLLNSSFYSAMSGMSSKRSLILTEKGSEKKIKKSFFVIQPPRASGDLSEQ